VDNKQINKGENVSSLMDGEFNQGSKDCKRDLDAIMRCEQSKLQWERFHLLSELIVEEKGILASTELCLRVSNAIEQEPHRIGSTRWLKKDDKPSNLWKQMVGMGVAASVTAVIVTGIQSVDPLTTELEAKNQFTTQYSAALSSVTPASARVEHSFEAPSLAEQKRIEKLFLEHTMSTSENGLKGLLPYAKVVSYRRIPTQVTKVDVDKKAQIIQNKKSDQNSQNP
jgi:negative regulator of sigma E activity